MNCYCDIRVFNAALPIFHHGGIGRGECERERGAHYYYYVYHCYTIMPSYLASPDKVIVVSVEINAKLFSNTLRSCVVLEGKWSSLVIKIVMWPIQISGNALWQKNLLLF